MRKHEVVTVALRLLGIALLFSVLESAPKLLAYRLQTDESGQMFMLLTAVSEVLVAILLFRFAPALSGLLLPGAQETSPVISWNRREVLETALVVVGLYFLLRAIVDASYWAVLIVKLRHTEYGGEPLKPERIANIWSTGIELALSGMMVFRPGILASFMQGRRASVL
jgi:hypothetical protein